MKLKCAPKHTQTRNQLKNENGESLTKQNQNKTKESTKGTK
jgi:hypothetical protein